MICNVYFALALLIAVVGLVLFYRLQYRRKLIEATIYNASSDAMFICDQNGKFLSINNAFEELTGYSADEVVNKPLSAISSEISSREFYGHLQESVQLQKEWEGEISDCHKDGSIFFKLFSLKMVTPSDQEKRYIGSFLNMSKIEEVNQKLWYQANFDDLTGLPNRHMFFDHIQQQIDKAERYIQQMGMIYLDLNNFDKINYTIGHAGGDTLIKLVVKRLENAIRSNDLLYRIGGIEFVILLPNVDGELTKIADAILAELTEPFEVQGMTISISINMGLVMYPNDGTSPDDLLQKADEAVLRSKREGINRYARFNKSMIRRREEI